MKFLPAVPAEHNRVEQCLAPDVGLVLLRLQREIAFLRGLQRCLYFTSCGDKLMQAKGKKAPIRTNFHLIGSQEEIPQRCQNLVVMKPCSIPTVSLRTFATGARQLVVHDALETTVWPGSSLS